MNDFVRPIKQALANESQYLEIQNIVYAIFNI